MLCYVRERPVRPILRPWHLEMLRTNGDNTILYVIKCDVLHFMKACKVKVMLFNVINKMNNNIPKKGGIKANIFSFRSLGFIAHPLSPNPSLAGAE